LLGRALSGVVAEEPVFMMRTDDVPPVGTLRIGAAGKPAANARAARHASIASRLRLALRERSSDRSSCAMSAGSGGATCSGLIAFGVVCFMEGTQELTDITRPARRSCGEQR
jgi:hypothetical protein